MSIGFLAFGFAFCCGVVYLLGFSEQEENTVKFTDYSELYRELAIEEL